MASILAVCALLAAGGMWYFSRSAADAVNDSLKNQISFGQTLASLNKTANMLRSELASSSRAMQSLTQDFLLVKSVCQSDQYCNERYRNALIGALLKKNGLVVEKEEYQSSGLNFYKYFLEPPRVPTRGPSSQEGGPLGSELLAFIKNNCPASISIPGLLSVKYRYRVADTKVAEILMNDDSNDITCAWIIDESAKTFTKLQ